MIFKEKITNQSPRPNPITNYCMSMPDNKPLKGWRVNDAKMLELYKHIETFFIEKESFEVIRSQLVHHIFEETKNTWRNSIGNQAIQK